MDLFRKARKLEAAVTRVLEGATRSALKSEVREPLEIVQAIVEKVVAEVQPVGRGKHVFPFNRIKVFVVAASAEARARVSVVFDTEPTLQTRIVETLRAEGCEPGDLAVKIGYLAGPQVGWSNAQWHIEFGRVTPALAVEPAPAVVAAQPAIELTIVKGTGAPDSSTFAQGRIEIGRCAEVRDGRNRLIRTNHVVFADEAGAVNDSVSRCHAHIDFNAAAGEYRVHDDRSGHGTSVLRDGRAMAVPPGARGIRLRSGDEILLGEARVRVRI